MDMPPDLTLSSAFFMSSSDQCTAAVLDNSIPTYRGKEVWVWQCCMTSISG